MSRRSKRQRRRDRNWWELPEERVSRAVSHAASPSGAGEDPREVLVAGMRARIAMAEDGKPQPVNLLAEPPEEDAG